MSERPLNVLSARAGHPRDHPALVERQAAELDRVVEARALWSPMPFAALSIGDQRPST